MTYLEPGGVERRAQLSECWNVPFERVSPVRSFSSYRGQRHFSGSWWSATTRDHVQFESWLERDQLLLLDFEPQVVAIAAQPFWLSRLEDGAVRRHAPDFFVRHADGTGVVVDVRADDRVDLEAARVFDWTARVCASVGWDYRRVGAVPPVLLANVRWLAGYRHPRCLQSQHAERLEQAFRRPVPLLDGVRAVGDPLGILPTAFHMLWSGRLSADLHTTPLSAGSIVSLIPDGGRV